MIDFYPLTVFIENRLERFETEIREDIMDVIANISFNISEIFRLLMQLLLCFVKLMYILIKCLLYLLNRVCFCLFNHLNTRYQSLKKCFLFLFYALRNRFSIQLNIRNLTIIDG